MVCFIARARFVYWDAIDKINETIELFKLCLVKLIIENEKLFQELRPTSWMNRSLIMLSAKQMTPYERNILNEFSSSVTIFKSSVFKRRQIRGEKRLTYQW